MAYGSQMPAVTVSDGEEDPTEYSVTLESHPVPELLLPTYSVLLPKTASGPVGPTPSVMTVLGNLELTHFRGEVIIGHQAA